MKRVRSAGSVAVKVILCATVLIFVSSLWTDESTTGDLTQNVEVFAAAGVLKYHARNETQYRDLTSGPRSMTSGSFLKTGNGPANFILPGDSVLSLDANTEVQLGMYDNGILIWQRSGRAWHFVERQEGKTYAVRTPFYMAKAVGTEYRTLNNYPIEGAVTVIWGTVKIVSTGVDPQTGEILPGGLSGFVPQGHKCIWPPDPNDAFQLNQGDHETFHAGQAPRSGASPADDSWSSRNRTRSQIIRELNRRRRAGHMTPEDYRQKLGALLGISPDLIPGQPFVPLGGLWIGSSGPLILKMCIIGNTISELHVVDLWQAMDKETNRATQQFVNFTFPRGVQFSILEGGRVYDGASVEDGIWKGATIFMFGHIGASTGRLTVNIYSETDTTVYWGTCTTLDIHLVDPNGCNY